MVIYRGPRRISIVSPRSRCPYCLNELTWRDNIPLLSWLFLRGKCRSCARPISVRYPVVEAITGASWALVFMVVGLTAELPLALALATVGVIVAATDLDLHIIPNRVLGPAFLLALALLAVGSIWGELSFGRGLVGSLLYGVPMLALALAVPRGMGIGDVKLAFYLGLHLGAVSLASVAIGAMAAFSIGGVVGVALIVTGVKGRKDRVPFGPSMVVGGMVAFLAGDVILRIWMDAVVFG